MKCFLFYYFKNSARCGHKMFILFFVILLKKNIFRLDKHLLDYKQV